MTYFIRALLLREHNLAKGSLAQHLNEVKVFERNLAVHAALRTITITTYSSSPHVLHHHYFNMELGPSSRIKIVKYAFIC